MKCLKNFPALLALFLILSLLTDLLTVPVSAVNSEPFGKNLIWSFDKTTSKIIISAKSELNEMPDYDNSSIDLFSQNLPAWESLKKSVKTLVIKDGVNNIGGYAFYGFKALQSVSLPKSILTIGAGAFYGCKSLKTISFPGRLNIIGYGAFKDCILLQKLSFPATLSEIGGCAFDNCKSIKSIYIPENVTDIKSYAFKGCNKVETIKVSVKNKKYKSIGNCLININSHTLMFGCKNSVIPSDGSVTVIEPYAFYKCAGLKSINIPSKNAEAVSIGQSAFEGCTSLKNVYFYGTKSDWNTLKRFNFGINNSPLLKATCHLLSFDDVNMNSWYANAIRYVSTANIITGYKNGKFGIGNTLLRQDAVVMLARLSKEVISDYISFSPFKDIKKNNYYTAAVTWAKKNKIVTGYANGNFGVGEKITREQFVCFLYRYAKYKGINLKLKNNQSFFTRKYKDYAKVSLYARTAICWALENKIIRGKNSNTIAPQGYAKREEIAQIFYNMFTRSVF